LLNGEEDLTVHLGGKSVCRRFEERNRKGRKGMGSRTFLKTVEVDADHGGNSSNGGL